VRRKLKDERTMNLEKRADVEVQYEWKRSGSLLKEITVRFWRF